MKTKLLGLAALIVVSALVPAPIRAQAARSGLLVSTSWLAENLRNPKLVLLHVGSRSEYEAGHLPGARYISLEDISISGHDKPGELMLQVPEPEQLRESLQKLGISDDSRIVVYYGKDWVTPATRVVFTLDHAGLGGQTSLLDGNLDVWRSENREVSTDVPPAKAGKLSPLRLRGLVVDGDWVQANIGKPGISVVDGRAAAFYDGVQRGMGMQGSHKAGHIAGAKSFPFTNITDARMRFRSRDELAVAFAKAGVKPGDTVVGYCHIGQQATGMLFAARLLGHKVLLYDGSFEDWSARPGSAVETTASK
jgi:thiosulfate/3-mercaptopyruvate sulfurtransferase